MQTPIMNRTRDNLAELIEETYLWDDTNTFHSTPEFLQELTNAQRHAILQDKANDTLSYELEYYMEYIVFTDNFIRTWVVGVDSDDPQHHIWVSSKPSFRGLGGHDMTFPLRHNAGSITLEGPWHSNQHSFKDSTGLDIRDFAKKGKINSG